MKVENKENEINLSFSKNILDWSEIQSFIDFVKFREINSLSTASIDEVEELAEEINQTWWEKNKNKFE